MSGIADPRQTTFDVLKSRGDRESGDVMVAALTSADDSTRKLSATALVEQRSQLSLVEVIRQVDTLSDEVCEEFAQAPDRFATVIRQCISGPDTDVRRAAIAFVHRTANYTHFPLLMKLLQHEEATTRSAAANSLRKLAESFALVLLSAGGQILPGMRFDTARTMQQELLARLDGRAADADRLDNPAAVVESLLLLGVPGHESVRNVLDRRGEYCQQLAVEFLATSQHPAIFELLCGSLDRPFPPLQMFDVIERRDDLEFALFLLDWLPQFLMSRNVLGHLAKFSGLTWLDLDHETLQAIPPEKHDRLVTLVNAIGVTTEERCAIKAWVVRCSGPAGRDAASDVLYNLTNVEVQEILYDALTHDDPQVEAWATRQLRSQRMPDCFDQLLERLDRDTNEVRGAARDELSDFNLDRLLDLFPRLPKSTSARCGDVLLKINPEAHQELREEFKHSFRWRRVRAARAAAELGLVDYVLAGLTELLDDPEATVRRSAIESLATVQSPTTITAIQSCLDDMSRMVRESAIQALSDLDAPTLT